MKLKKTERHISMKHQTADGVHHSITVGYETGGCGTRRIDTDTAPPCFLPYIQLWWFKETGFPRPAVYEGSAKKDESQRRLHGLLLQVTLVTGMGGGGQRWQPGVRLISSCNSHPSTAGKQNKRC